MQHVPIGNAPGDTLHQFGMRNAVKVPRQVRVDDMLVSSVQEPMNRFYRVLRSPLCPICKLLWLQIGLEDGLRSTVQWYRDHMDTVRQ